MGDNKLVTLAPCKARGTGIIDKVYLYRVDGLDIELCCKDTDMYEVEQYYKDLGYTLTYKDIDVKVKDGSTINLKCKDKSGYVIYMRFSKDEWYREEKEKMGDEKWEEINTGEEYKRVYQFG